MLMAAALLIGCIPAFSTTASAAAASKAPVAETPCPAPCSTYDLIVIGSEIEGMFLARAAHNLGKRVLVLDPRPKPGGQLIQGQMMVLDEPNDAKGRSLVQGELKKLYDGYKDKRIRKVSEFNTYYNNLIHPLPMRSSISIEAIKTAPRGDKHSLQYIIYRAQDGHRYNVAAEQWVENTDHAALTGLLKLKRIPGTESLFQGGGPEPEYMAATFVLRFKNVDWVALHEATLQDYPLPKLARKYGPGTYVDWSFGTGFSNVTANYEPTDPQLKLRGINSTYQRNGQVIMNALLIYDVDPSDPESVRTAVKKGKAEAPHVLKFLKNNIPGYARAELDTLPEYLYIREFDRYETEYVLRRNDLLNKRMFWDNVSIGGYAIDVQGTRRFPNGQSLGAVDRYGLPLRSFLLKEIDNVIVVGKNTGAAADAYGSVRILPNTALAAQVIGILIGREQKPLRDLTESDFKRIHGYLKKDYAIHVAG
jgi:hypothetical protein